MLTYYILLLRKLFYALMALLKSDHVQLSPTPDYAGLHVSRNIKKAHYKAVDD